MTSSFRIALSLAMAAFVAGAASAQEKDGAKALAERDRVAQEEVQASAAQIQQQIALINQELRGNGIDESQIGDIDAVLRNLTNLSANDMAGVISLLKDSSGAESEKSRQTGLVTAYKGEQGIMTKMSTLIASVQIKQTTDQLHLQLQNMLLRQIANLRLSSDLQKLGKDAAALGDHDKGRLEVAAANQATLQANYATVLEELNRLTVQLPADEAAPFKEKLSKLGSDDVRHVAESASGATKAGNWSVALPAQTKFRDSLLASLDLVTPPDLPAAVDQAAQEVARLVEAAKAAIADKSETHAETQAAVQDMAVLTALKLPGVNAEAAQKVAEAQRNLEQTRTAPDTKESATAGQAALAALQQSLDLLKKQAAEVAKARNDTPQQRLEKLQQVAAQLNQAQQQEAQAAQNPASPQNTASTQQQQQLAAQLAKLQQDTAPVNSEASRAIGKAALETAPANPDHPPDNASAARHLAEAQDAVQKQIAQAQANADQAQKVAQAQQTLQKADQQLAQAAQQMQKQSGLPEAVNKLLDAQKTLQNTASPTLPASAQQALDQAQKALQDATMQAAQGKQSEAQAGTQKVQQALAQAKGALQQAAQQLQAAGMPPMPSSSSPTEQATDTSSSQNGAALVTDGSGGTATEGSALVMGKLKPQDRQAIAAMKGEKAPPEYAPLVSQYYKNLADGTGR